MDLYRIASAKHSTKLTSSGAPNRWNKKGEHVIYVGSSRSLSTLELIVHRNYIKPELIYKVMVISTPDDSQLINTIKLTDLPKNWRKFAAYSTLQDIGSRWFNSKVSLMLKVPSAIIPNEYNYLINTEHPDFKENIELSSIENYFWDERLL